MTLFKPIAPRRDPAWTSVAAEWCDDNDPSSMLVKFVRDPAWLPASTSELFVFMDECLNAKTLLKERVADEPNAAIRQLYATHDRCLTNMHDWAVAYMSRIEQLVKVRDAVTTLISKQGVCRFYVESYVEQFAIDADVARRKAVTSEGAS